MRITRTPVAVGHCFHRYSVAVLWFCLIWDRVLIPSKGGGEVLQKCPICHQFIILIVVLDTNRIQNESVRNLH